MQPDQLKAFRDGLYRVLLAGDVSAFGRYLRQWEDLIGDTADLAETSEAQQRRTMDALLRRPQQFNLPPWPRDTPAPAEPCGALEDQAEDGADKLAEEHAAAEPVELAEAKVKPRITAASGDVPAHNGWAHSEVADPDSRATTIPPSQNVSEPGAAYQVDMLTGELVPVHGISVRVLRRQAELLEPADSPDPAASAGVNRSRRGRRRRLPAGMTQLSMWIDEEPAG